MQEEIDESEYIREFQEVLFDVLDVLEGADVDVSQRKIIVGGRRLSIEETAEQIHSDSGWPCDKILGHIVSWLEMTYEPANLDEAHDGGVREGDRTMDQAIRRVTPTSDRTPHS